MNEGYHMGRSASWYHDHGAECCGIGPFENNHFPIERAVASKISVISTSFGKPHFKIELLMQKETIQVTHYPLLPSNLTYILGVSRGVRLKFSI